MPFCTNCGTEVSTSAAFCGNCGARQTPQASTADPLTAGLSDRVASMLCYIPVFGVLPAIFFLSVQRYRGNQRVRFDAFQSVYLFVAFLVASSVLPPIFWISFPGVHIAHALVGMVKAGIFLLSLYLLISALQEKQIALPIVGDLARKSAAEQL